MEQLPFHIGLVFTLSAFLAVYLFYTASNYSKVWLIGIVLWMLFQMAMGVSEFYLNANTVPPRFLLMVLPPMALLIVLFNTKKGKAFIDSLSLKYLYILHIVRIPVEFVLLWLSLEKMVPQLMTFEGRNFDIISGITAPLVYYFGYHKKVLSNKLMLIWNFLCIGLLLNIVIHAVLSAPFAFQQFAFEQPNIAVLYFPFNWLPSIVVPLVLFSHLAAIRQLFGVGSTRNME
jgi:hypothetical protein